MKRQIRAGVFETNSSSTHSLVICSKEEYEKLQKGELFIDYYYDKLISSKEDAKYPEDVITLDEFFDNDYLETFSRSYTTPKGEEVVAFGKYGYNG